MKGKKKLIHMEQRLTAITLYAALRFCRWQNVHSAEKTEHQIENEYFDGFLIQQFDVES